MFLPLLRYLILASLLPLGTAHADTIWKCQDLQQVPEFSTIQCAPDAKVYVPSRPNAGTGIGARSADDERYKDFIRQHNERFEAEQRKRLDQRDRSRSRSLKRFKNYSVPAR